MFELSADLFKVFAAIFGIICRIAFGIVEFNRESLLAGINLLGLMIGALEAGMDGFLGGDLSLGVDDLIGDFLVGVFWELVEET